MDRWIDGWMDPDICNNPISSSISVLVLLQSKRSQSHGSLSALLHFREAVVHVSMDFMFKEQPINSVGYDNKAVFPPGTWLVEVVTAAVSTCLYFHQLANCEVSFI